MRTPLVLANLAILASVSYSSVASGQEETALSSSNVATSQAVPTEHQADEKAIRKSAEEFIQAFNAGDADALAAFWTPNGQLVDATGTEFHGREAIKKEYASSFAANPGLTLALSIDSIRFVSAEVAFERGTARVGPTTFGSFAGSRYTAVHVKQDGKWRVASIEESPAQTKSNYAYLEKLGRTLEGSWQAAADDGVVTMTCEWALNRNFLTRTYTLAAGGTVESTGIQIIGWDPLARQATSWLFDSTGAVETGTWQETSDGWRIKLSGVLRDGRRMSAVNTITKVGKDKFVWKSAERAVDGVVLPDTQPIEVVRAAPSN